MVNKTVLAAVIIAAVAFIFFNPTLLIGPYSVPGSIDCLHGAERIEVAGAFGPESIAFDPSGEGPYTGVSDGRILKRNIDGSGWTVFSVTSTNRDSCSLPFAPAVEHICGRPLGLTFENKTGDLYIADAYFGLLVVGPGGGPATRLVAEAEGVPLVFTNAVDIDEDRDLVYFTDSSTRFQRRRFMEALLSGDRTGRLLRYDKSSKAVTVLVEGLSFPNGVAVGGGGSFVLVAETGAGRVVRVWVDGPRAGGREVFADLPGNPDNIRRNGEGEFWVALHSKKTLASRLLMATPWFGRTLMWLPLGLERVHRVMVGGRPHAAVVKLGRAGDVLQVLEDADGTAIRFVSEVEERSGQLWFGSVLTPFLGLYRPSS